MATNDTNTLTGNRDNYHHNQADLLNIRTAVKAQLEESGIRLVRIDIVETRSQTIFQDYEFDFFHHKMVKAVEAIHGAFCDDVELMSVKKLGSWYRAVLRVDVNQFLGRVEIVS